MAKHPFSNFKDPSRIAPGVSVGYGAFPNNGTYHLGVVCGLASYATGGGGHGTAFGVSSRRAIHAIQVYDVLGGTNQGRRVQGLTVQDSVNPFTPIPNLFSTSGPAGTVGVPLQGNSGADENVDPPDLPIQGGAIFVADGARRGDIVVGNTPVGGTVIPTFQFKGQEQLNGTNGLIELDDGGVFTRQFQGTNTISLLPTVGNQMKLNDAIYFSNGGQFGQIAINVQTPGVGAWVLTWEYWNGAAWATLPSFAATGGAGASDFKVLGVTTLTWIVPATWPAVASGTITGQPLFWIRGRVTTQDLAPTTQPLGGTAVMGTGGGNSISTLRMGNYLLNRVPSGAPVAFAEGAWTSTTVGDALYVASASQFSGFTVTSGQSAGGGGTFAFEYWDGTAWTSIPSVLDSTAGFTVVGSLSWPIPGNWAALNAANALVDWPAQSMLPIGKTTGLLYIMRIRVISAPSAAFSYTYQSNSASTNEPSFISQAAATGDRYTGACIHVGDDPHDASQTSVPGVVGWGIPLPPGVTANPQGLFTFWDAVRLIHSKRFTPQPLAANPTHFIYPDHPYANVTHVAQWSDATQNATLVGIQLVNTVGYPASGADPRIIIGNDAGAPVTYDEAVATTDSARQLQLGFWRTATVHRRRMWVGGATTSSLASGSAGSLGSAVNLANRVIWSELDNPHHFQNIQSFSFIDVDADDGDEIQALRSLGDVLLILKTRSIHILTGNPQGSGQTGLQVRRVEDIGCVAKRSAVVIHGRCFFLSQDGVYAVDRTGQVTPVALSEPIQPLIAGLKRNLLDKAHAIHDPAQGLYILSVPGLTRQLRGCGDTGREINDGCFAYDLQRGQWAVWPGIYACSMASAKADDTDSQVWVGDYWGGIFKMTDDFADHPNVTGLRYRGVCDVGSTTTSIVDRHQGTGIPSSNSLTPDGRHIMLDILMTSGPAAGQRRSITLSDNFPHLGFPGYTVSPAFTVAPKDGDTFEIGSVGFWVESGDLDFGAPSQEKAMRSVRTFLRQPIDPQDAIDYAVSPDDSLDPNAVNHYSADTVDSGTMQPAGVDLPPEPGSTQRLRIQGSMAASRPVIRSIQVEIIDTGEQRA